MWGDESKSLTTSGFKAAIRKWRAVNAALPMCPLQLNSIYWHSKMQLPARTHLLYIQSFFKHMRLQFLRHIWTLELSARKMSDHMPLWDAHEQRNCGKWHFSIVLWHSFSSTIFYTGHNGPEMCRVSCSLFQLILLKWRKHETYCTCLAFLKFPSFINPTRIFSSPFFPSHEWRLNSISLFPSTVQRKNVDIYFFLCWNVHMLSDCFCFWKSRLSIRPSSGPSITENKIKNGNDHRKVEIFLEI